MLWLLATLLCPRASLPAGLLALAAACLPIAPAVVRFLSPTTGLTAPVCPASLLAPLVLGCVAAA
jgi:hypothetical protein